ncbi:MAG TPA: hypothetical protein VFN10_06535 [Thermoanaerobaculia bacterium]|nr:hypothetical protein [Thermoanaerobaculia bacterium]
MDEHHIARNLGWFSIALGLTELAAPRQLARALGIDRGTGLIRAFGAREIAAGVGILTQRKRAPWLWARVAGDVLDLGALVAALVASRKRGAVTAAIAAVTAVTALDVICGGQLTREEA